MNVKVYAGGTLAYDNLLPVEKGYTMQSILIRERKNTGGSATLLLPANHPLRDGFPAFKTPVEIYRDGVLRWRGRTLPESRDFYCRGKITCEGELCFLQDSTLRPGTYSGDLPTVFTKFIDAHNARVEEWKRFVVGNVTVATDEIVEVTLKAGQKTYSAVQDLCSSYGGIILFDSSPDGTRRINWYAEMPYSCNQQIALGVNLTDYSSSVDATGFATRIVPYGAQDADGNPVTIDVDGKDYVESAEGVALRGVIEASVSYPDISDPEELRAAAQRDVDKAATLPETIKLSALDISRQNLNLEAFRVGQRTKAESAPHKLSGYYDLVAMEEDLISCGAGSITLTKDSVYNDGAGSTLTGAVSSQGKQNFEKEHGASIASLTAAILGAKGGAVRLLDTDGDKLPDTLYIADNPDPTIAKKVWRFNYNGWGASQNGYNGPFETGATLEDGLLSKSFTATAQAYLPPTYDDVMGMLWSLSFPDKFPTKDFYDLNGDGTFNRDDVIMALDIYRGVGELSSCPSAHKSEVTVIIDPSNTEASVLITGINMWGSEITISLGTTGSRIPIIKGNCSVGGILSVGSHAIIPSLAITAENTPKTLSWKDNGDGTFSLIGK